MGRKLTPPPEALHNTTFTRKEALQAGLTPGQLRSHQYKRIAPSIYCHRDTTPTPNAIARAYSRSRPRIVITGIQAAQHYKFPLPHWIENPTHDPNTPTPRISLWSRTWRRDHPDHHLEWNKRRLKPGDVTTLPDPEFPTHIRITTVERTWFDLANILDLENMVIILDHIIRIPNPKYENREKPLSTPERIAAFIDTHPHTPGHQNRSGSATAHTHRCGLAARNPATTRLPRSRSPGTHGQQVDRRQRRPPHRPPRPHLARGESRMRIRWRNPRNRTETSDRRATQRAHRPAGVATDHRERHRPVPARTARMAHERPPSSLEPTRQR